MTTHLELERALVLDTVRVTEQAALAASRWVGKGDKTQVDRAGTEAMRRVLNELRVAGQVVIGEGEIDEAPMPYIGERLGQGETAPSRSTSRWTRSRAPRSPAAVCPTGWRSSPSARPGA